MSEAIKFSLSSEEDIYDFLNKLSYIYEGKEKDDEMFSVYCDFTELVKAIPSNEYITLYHDVKIGGTNSRKSKNTIEEYCSHLLNIEVEEFDSLLLANIVSLKRANYDRWLSFINTKYKNVDFRQEVNNSSQSQHTPINRTVELPKPRKLRKTVITSEQEENKRKDMQGLLDYVTTLEKNIKLHENNGEGESNTCRKMVGTRIQVLKDINIIRKSYGEALGRQNNIGKRSFTSYEGGTSSYDEAVYAHEEQQKLIKENQQEGAEREEKLKAIKKVAKNVLTNRQFIIFEFYYFNELTQQEIADVMGIKQNTVSEYIDRLISKIQSNIL